MTATSDIFLIDRKTNISLRFKFVIDDAQAVVKLATDLMTDHGLEPASELPDEITNISLMTSRKIRCSEKVHIVFNCLDDIDTDIHATTAKFDKHVKCMMAVMHELT